MYNILYYRYGGEDMNGKICFFIGHSDAPQSVYPELVEAVERHITEYSVTDFRVGNYGAFDRMAARAVKEAKASHPAGVP